MSRPDNYDWHMEEDIAVEEVYDDSKLPSEEELRAINEELYGNDNHGNKENI